MACMSNKSTYLGSWHVGKSNKTIFINSKALLFLAMSLLICTIFSRGLHSSLIFLITYILGVILLFLACLYLVGLFLEGTRGTMKFPMCNGEVVSRFWY